MHNITGGAAKPIHLIYVAIVVAVSAVVAVAAIDGIAGFAATARKKCGWGRENISFFPCFFLFPSSFPCACPP